MLNSHPTVERMLSVPAAQVRPLQDAAALSVHNVVRKVAKLIVHRQRALIRDLHQAAADQYVESCLWPRKF